MIETKKPSDLTLVVGAVLLLFKEKGYCANQIEAVLELVAARVDYYKNLEPITFDDFEGPAKEIQALREAEATEAD